MGSQGGTCGISVYRLPPVLHFAGIRYPLLSLALGLSFFCLFLLWVPGRSSQIKSSSGATRPPAGDHFFVFPKFQQQGGTSVGGTSKIYYSAVQQDDKTMMTYTGTVLLLYRYDENWYNCTTGTLYDTTGRSRKGRRRDGRSLTSETCLRDTIIYMG